jgi:hypothetical protein
LPQRHDADFLQHRGKIERGGLFPPSAAAAPALPTERNSAAGAYYGGCAGLTLAVVLRPEPCGWEEPGARIRVVRR